MCSAHFFILLVHVIIKEYEGDLSTHDTHKNTHREYNTVWNEWTIGNNLASFYLKCAENTVSHGRKISIWKVWSDETEVRSPSRALFIF